MDIATLIAAVAAFGLPCTNPELREYPAEEIPWPAAYVRAIEGQNLIVLREGIKNDMHRLPRILVHELLHCGLYEDRERRGQLHPRSLDPREEMAVHAMTDVVLKRLDGNGPKGAVLAAATKTPHQARGASRSVRTRARVMQKSTRIPATAHICNLPPRVTHIVEASPPRCGLSEDELVEAMTETTPGLDCVHQPA